MKILTKLLSALLIVAMCVSLIGSGAYAKGVDMAEETGMSAAQPEMPASGGAVNSGASVVDNGGTTVPNQPADYSGSVVDMGGDDDTDTDNDSTEKQEGGIQLRGLPSIVSAGKETYRSIGEAVDETKNTAKPVVKLLANHDLGAVTGTLDAAVTELTIDLAGKTLDMSDATGSCMSLTGTTSQKIVIIDSVGGGKVIGNGTDKMFDITNAELTIEAGTYSGLAADDIGNCTITGGSFVGEDPTDDPDVTFDDETLCTKTTEKTNEDSTTYNVYDIVAAAAKIGSTVYPSLAEALAAAADGDTVTLLSDISGESLKVTKNITLDLNGKTLTEKDPIVLEAKLVVKDDVGTGRIAGASSSATLFDIKQVSKDGALEIRSGAMTKYSKLYVMEATDSTATPVDLYGGLYDVKPADIDVASGLTVYGSAAPYSIRAKELPTITENGTVEYNSDYFLMTNGGKYVNDGYIIHYTAANEKTSNREYKLDLSSKNLNSVYVDGYDTTNKLDNPGATAEASKMTVISTESPLFTGLTAGRYDIVFEFDEGDVKIPLYIMPDITAVEQYAIPDSAEAGVKYTFNNPPANLDVDPVTFPTMMFGKTVKSAKTLTDADFTRDATSVTVGYDFLYDNFPVEKYNMYFWFDARIGSAMELSLIGTTNPEVTTSTTPTASPTTSPTPVTSASIKLNASNSALWYNGLSNTLKFDVTPADAVVQIGGSTLTAGTDYTIENGVLTLKQSYLNKLPYKHASCVNNTTCVNGASYTIRVTSPTDGTYAETTFQVLPSVYAVNDITQHTYGGTKTLSFTASDPIIGVYVGKVLLDPSQYTLSSDNKTVTLSAAFLNNTLGIGDYYLTVLLDDADGSDHVATCQFHVISASSAAIAQSMGDTSNIFIWIAVLVICAVAVIALIPKKKKTVKEDAEPEDKQE